VNDISIGDLIAQFKDSSSPKLPKKSKPKIAPKNEENHITEDPPKHTTAKQWFQEFQEWLAEDYEHTVHPVRKPGLHASGLGRVCGRKDILISEFGIPKNPNTSGNYLTFDIGHAMHYWWQERYLGPKQELLGDWACMGCPCPKCGLLIKAQPDLTREEKVAIFKACDQCRSTGRKVTRGLMPLNCECGIRWQDAIRYLELPVINKELNYIGHCDGILKTTKRLFEFKSISPSEYKKLEHGPKYDHVVQAHAYMVPLGLKEALIVYVNKGSQCKWSVDMFGQFVAGDPKVIPFVVKYSDDIWQPIVARVHDWHKAMKVLTNVKKDERRLSRKELTMMPRVCADNKCEMAKRCPVSRECFTLDAPS
jgi:hypothetical protein